jgi:hypothetical protein
MVVIDTTLVAATLTFLTLIQPLFAVFQGLMYLSYIGIAMALIGSGLAAFGIAVLKIILV